MGEPPGHPPSGAVSRQPAATVHMTLPVPRAVDLRREPVDEVLGRVEQSLQTVLDRQSVVRRRRSVGARTDRHTWVRIERRGLDRISTQGERAILQHGPQRPEAQDPAVQQLCGRKVQLPQAGVGVAELRHPAATTLQRADVGQVAARLVQRRKGNGGTAPCACS